jgi:tryptophanyl-tRNA synthetase
MEADVVPVGRDQIQHVEIAADIAGSFNHVYGNSFRFKIPTAVVPDTETGRTLPGLDGSKNEQVLRQYHPAVLRRGAAKKMARRIPTDSTKCLTSILSWPATSHRRLPCQSVR